MTIWNNFLCYHPCEDEDVLLRITDKKTDERYYTIGHIKDILFNSRGMEPSNGFSDNNYAYHWIYISEVECILEENDTSLPGLINGD